MFSCVLQAAIQAAKVAGGTHILKQLLQAFRPQSMTTTMLIDLVNYDSFPALAALEVHPMCFQFWKTTNNIT